MKIRAKQVEQAAESLGAEIAEAENKQVEKAGKVAPTLYLGMNGTGVPMRPQEVIGRAGKHTDGSSKAREAKLVTVLTAESHDDEGKPKRVPGSVTYSGALESAATPDTSSQMSDFAERISCEADRRDFNEVPRQALLGDGAIWIWNPAARLFPPGNLDSLPISCQGTHHRHNKTPLPRWHRKEELDSKPL